jgi:hypothetical protein
MIKMQTSSPRPGPPGTPYGFSTGCIYDPKGFILKTKKVKSFGFRMREQHIITAVEGHNHNIVFLIPPLCFSVEDAKKFSNSLKNILVDIESHPKEALCENISQGAERYSK